MNDEHRPAVLVVNHNARNLALLAEYLGRQGYNTTLVQDVDACAALLQEEETFQAALIDISGFNAQIWQCCQQLQQKNIPFIIISHRQSDELLQTSIRHGARSVMVKPLVIKELLNAIQRLL